MNEQDLIDLNQLVVEQTGEPHLVLEVSRVANAAAAPLNTFHYADEGDLIVLAIRLLEALTQGHAFAQGNKRTALVAAIAFLERNNIYPAIADYPGLANRIEMLVTHKIDATELCAYFRANSINIIGKG